MGEINANVAPECFVGQEGPFFILEGLDALEG
jgi:hypothetical protein